MGFLSIQFFCFAAAVGASPGAGLKVPLLLGDCTEPLRPGLRLAVLHSGVLGEKCGVLAQGASLCVLSVALLLCLPTSSAATNLKRGMPGTAA